MVFAEGDAVNSVATAGAHVLLQRELREDERRACLQLLFSQNEQRADTIEKSLGLAAKLLMLTHLLNSIYRIARDGTI